MDIKTLPLRLIAWGALGVALHVGLARFAYGVVLPSLRNELGLGFTAGGVLNALHLAGYLAGTLMGPMLGRRMGLAQQMRAGNLLTAAGALLCAVVPTNFWGDSLLLGARAWCRCHDHRHHGQRLLAGDRIGAGDRQCPDVDRDGGGCACLRHWRAMAA